jgi:hypothetical protein
MASSMKRWFPAVTLLVVATILVAQTLSPAQDSTLPTIPDRQSPSSFVSEPPSIYEQKPIEATGLVGENVRHPSAPDFAPATPYASPQGRSNAPVVNATGFQLRSTHPVQLLDARPQASRLRLIQRTARRAKIVRSAPFFRHRTA